MKFKPPQAQGVPQPQQGTGPSRRGDIFSPPPSTFSTQDMNQNKVDAAIRTPTDATVTPADGLAQGLAAALQAGLAQKAAELAAELANLKIKCEIKVQHELNRQRSKQAEFSVKVHVEDRVADRCYITFLVKALDTIEDLKRKMMILHNLPMEVQRWIIGKKIHQDQTTLYQCGVRGPGHTLYLYLVTSRSVGLSKANYEAQRQAILLMQQANTQQSSPGPADHSASLEPGDTGVETLSPSNPSGDSMDQTVVVPLTCRPGFYPGNPSSSSVSPGSMRIQEMLQSPHLSGFSGALPSGTPGTPVENVLSYASPGQGMGEAWAINSSTVSTNSTTSTSAAVTNTNAMSSNSMSQQDWREPVFPSASPTGPPIEDDEEENEGWVCPACTYLNLPMWPGCEICDSQRPEDYEVPENYQMTEREMRMLQSDQVIPHEPLVPGPKPLWQQELQVNRAPSAKPYRGLEHLQGVQATNTPVNSNQLTNIFATDNSLVLHDITDEQDDNDLRSITPQPVTDLSDVLHALQSGPSRALPGRLGIGRPMEHDLVDGLPHYSTDGTCGHYSSDEENSHA